MKLFEISIDGTSVLWDWIGPKDVSDDKKRAYWEHLSLNPLGMEIKDIIIDRLKERIRLMESK
jgi:hypothetical protein